MLLRIAAENRIDLHPLFVRFKFLILWDFSMDLQNYVALVIVVFCFLLWVHFIIFSVLLGSFNFLLDHFYVFVILLVSVTMVSFLFYFIFL